MNKIRIILADDQTIIRDGLKALLEAVEDIEVIGEAGNGQETCRLAESLKPDLILMDIRMPVLDGVAATKAIKQLQPDAVILILTTFDDDDYIIEAMSHGAAGYLLKDISAQRLVEAVRDAVRGSLILPGQIAAKITSRLISQVDPSVKLDKSDFSSREIDIIKLLTAGKNNREIADELFLSLGTVKNYISQIYLKINTSDRAKALLLLRQINFNS
jgi:DNA-binding NarL/FixJ family response regulator